MAHSALHFSLGMAIGAAATLRPILRSWRGDEKLAPLLRKSFVLSCGLGVFAIIPSLFRSVGLPAAFCEGWWMNLFLLHPVVDRIKTGDTIMGTAGVIFCFTFHYLLLLAALRRTRKRMGKKTAGSSGISI